MICDKSLLSVSGLMHGTETMFFEEILKKGSLIAGKGEEVQLKTSSGERKPFFINKGVFFQILLTCNQNKPIPICSKSIILIFSKSLLSDRNDYHITNNWTGGMKLQPLSDLPPPQPTIKSFDKKHLTDFLDDPERCDHSFSLNEVVFERNVDLSYLQEIWICNQNSLTGLVNSVLPNGDIIRVHRQPDHRFYPIFIQKFVLNLLTKYNISVPVKLITLEEPIPDTCSFYKEGKIISYKGNRIRTKKHSSKTKKRSKDKKRRI